MRKPLLTLAAACALGALTACSSDEGTASTSQRQVGTRAPAPVAHGSYAFPQQDVPYQAVLAEAQRTGKPALLFFWTSW
ncbi:MAG: hypothetical protein QNJ90_06500 [Planctomycetota bacterium]|nr:hypothetical protein [Planctomycetota bacterium]